MTTALAGWEPPGDGREEGVFLLLRLLTTDSPAGRRAWSVVNAGGKQ